MKKRILYLAFAAVALALSLSSCSTGSWKNIKVTSFSIKSVEPTGLRSADGVISVGIQNPTISFNVTNIQGVIKQDGVEMMTISSSGTKVEGRAEQVYDIPVSASLTGNANIFSLAKVYTSSKLDSFTADISAKVSLPGGFGKTIEKKDIPLSSLVDKL